MPKVNDERLKEKIYEMLDKPMTISEIVRQFGLKVRSGHFHRFKALVLQLAMERPEVKVRKSGRVWIVWKEEGRKECGLKLVTGKYCDLIRRLADATGKPVEPCDGICEGCPWWQDWRGGRYERG